MSCRRGTHFIPLPNVPRWTAKGKGVGGNISLTRLQGHPCPEECDGPEGWANLKAAFKKRGDRDGYKAWYKHICVNGDEKGLDPYQWSIVDVNLTLERIEEYI